MRGFCTSTINMNLIDLNLVDLQLAAASVNIAADVNNGANLAIGVAKTFWSQIFSMGLFGRITKACLYIAGAGFIYKGWKYSIELGKNSLDLEKVITSLLTLILIFSLLNNSGALAMYTVLGFRNFTSNVSDTLMLGVSQDFQSRSAVQRLSDKLNAQPVFDIFKEQLKQCDTSPSPTCMPSAVANLKQGLIAQNITDPTILSVVTQIEADVSANISSTDPAAKKQQIGRFGKIMKAMQDPLGELYAAFQQIIKVLLVGVAIAFFLAIEIAMLVLGLTFPVNITLSLFSADPMKSWFGNFWTLVNAKICFSIITGIVVYLQLWGESNGLAAYTFVIELLLAVFSPFATYFYCQGSALAFAGALNMSAAAFAGGAKGAVSAAGSGSKRLGGAIAKVVTSKLSKTSK